MFVVIVGVIVIMFCCGGDYWKEKCLNIVFEKGKNDCYNVY